MTKRMVVFTITLIVAVLALASFAVADVPQMINYQGYLTSSSGDPLDTTVSMTFTIYDAVTNGNVKWSEIHPSVTVTNGLFNVILGAGTPPVPIEDSVFNQPDRWLGITVGTDPELTPRTQLVSVPYALHASGTGWVDDGTVVRLDTETDLVGIGTNTPEGKLHVYSNTGDEAIYAMSVSGGTGIAGYFQGGEKGVQAYVGSGSGYKFGVYGQTAGSDDLTGYGVYGVSNFGNGCIGVGGSASAGAGSSIGVAGRADGTGGTDHTGVDGYATDAEVTNIGVKGSAIGAAVTNYGFKSEAFGASTTNYGIYAEASGGTTNYAGYFDGNVHITGTLTGGGGGGGGWIDDGSVVRLDTGTDEVGVGTVSPDAKLHVAATQMHAGRFTSSVGTTDSAVFTAEYLGGGDVDAVAVHGISRANDYWGIGGRFEGNYMGLEAIAHPGTNPSAGYTGVWAKATGGNAINWGLRASADSCAEAIGVYATATNATERAIGVEGFANSNSSTVSTGVFGVGTGSSFINLGVNGLAMGSSATWNYGVTGEGQGASAGNIGVTGNAHENSGWKRGVSGSASGSGDNYGVYGAATDTSGTNNYGVYGAADNGQSNYAGWFDGDVNITGTLYGGKSGMRIDHPNDPENMYLQHSSVVSPDMMTVYNGNVVTDSEGRAVVTLPDYFDALNGDFRYQLTVIGSFSQAIIQQEISGNQFVIATDQPNVKVSWQVTGVRTDPVAVANRIETEIAKPSHELGKYQDPEAYGLSSERGLNQIEQPPANEQLDDIAKHQLKRSVK